MGKWVIVPLNTKHERDSFACGEPTPDAFLKQFARQNEAKGISRTYVLVREGEQRVMGYYTLAGGQISRDEMPPKAAKKLPNYPVPVVVLARLAVDREVQKEKLGRELLRDALNRSLEVSDRIGIHAIFVQAINEAASKFYQKFGFIPLAANPLQLYLPISSISEAKPVDE
jgi:predicted N-acetyltransferase YhbS